MIASPAPGLRHLITRKAALTRHYGADDPRTLAVAARLRVALAWRAVERAGLTEGERADLAALLTAVLPVRQVRSRYGAGARTARRYPVGGASA